MRKTRVVGAMIAGVAAVTMLGGPALADTNTSGDFGLGSGNQVQVPINVPVNVCGNSVGILGVANSAAKCGAVGINDL